MDSPPKRLYRKGHNAQVLVPSIVLLRLLTGSNPTTEDIVFL